MLYQISKIQHFYVLSYSDISQISWDMLNLSLERIYADDSHVSTILCLINKHDQEKVTIISPKILNEWKNIFIGDV
ncbi:hypothetical protein E2986_12016 [Frieseomelitta varia]|uniref:Uncharacterized protein n=1 Tax=Frieseomelitta varia TaxID=561572 RepID=A0A833RF20_9HYME|nr:hypothetical protein E2986_12016 [Frieseomelitta varia]